MSLIESSFHSSPLALLISNSQLKVITANKKAKNILCQGELKGKCLLDIFDHGARLKVNSNENGSFKSKDVAIEVKLNKITPERWFELSYRTLSEDPEHIVWGINDITMYKLKEKKLENLAYYDSLTGAYTRHYFFICLNSK
ncbi:hypothetical protein QYZ43_16915 [Vibrio parahaemolyticus]|nr:hypothetical protein [Vibrio parahaemolyticus]MDN4716574.1 hypothetical protein [Vibrio parahaemolyticus]MDN4718915.1 hypothetical protein [Vibrio parahaemolyticus]MDN4726445.1 hypothetical protein [Vibrio parahaemolyticus]MDN4728047.1 hypothetical protein [Vibrio parahaemolyticus]